MLNVYTYQMVFKEIPDKISLAFSITGCGGPCKNCHSPFLHQKESGEEMSLETFRQIILPYTNQLEVILFLGGEWESSLVDYLRLAREMGYETALYTGLELNKVSKELIANLDYIKVGAYIEELGGLDSPKTNQRLYYIKADGLVDITNKFLKEKKEGF